MNDFFTDSFNFLANFFAPLSGCQFDDYVYDPFPNAWSVLTETPQYAFEQVVALDEKGKSVLDYLDPRDWREFMPAPADTLACILCTSRVFDLLLEKEVAGGFRSGEKKTTPREKTNAARTKVRKLNEHDDEAEGGPDETPRRWAGSLLSLACAAGYEKPVKGILEHPGFTAAKMERAFERSDPLRDSVVLGDNVQFFLSGVDHQLVRRRRILKAIWRGPLINSVFLVLPQVLQLVFQFGKRVFS